MKLVTYDLGGGTPRAGIWFDGIVADLEKAGRVTAGGRLPASVRELLAGDPERLKAARATAAKVETMIAELRAGKIRRPAWLLSDEAVHLGPPVPDPQKVICLGLNYVDHCREQEGKFGRSVEPPERPVLFAKYPSALTGPNDPIRLPPASVAEKVAFEVELAMVIRKKEKGIKKKDEMD